MRWLQAGRELGRCVPAFIPLPAGEPVSGSGDQNGTTRGGIFQSPLDPVPDVERRLATTARARVQTAKSNSLSNSTAVDYTRMDVRSLAHAYRLGVDGWRTIKRIEIMGTQ
jgi:hypothetical protein